MSTKFSEVPKVLEQFKKDIENHRMMIVVDEDTKARRHRHIKFRKFDENNKCSMFYWFDIITWPGYLTIASDMGTYVFARTIDMFHFFRREDLTINESYWAEKVEAGTCSEFCPDKAKSIVLEHIKEYREELLENISTEKDSDEKEKIEEKYAELCESIETLTYDDESLLRAELSSLDDEYDNKLFHESLWEVSFKEYTYHYLWCCHAIVWGIQQYDKKASKDTGVVGPSPNAPALFSEWIQCGNAQKGTCERKENG